MLSSHTPLTILGQTAGAAPGPVLLLQHFPLFALLDHLGLIEPKGKNKIIIRTKLSILCPSIIREVTNTLN